MENSNPKIRYLDLWKDICFYDIYQDRINFENYVLYLVKKYNVDLDTLLIEIKNVRSQAMEKISKHHEEQKNVPLIFQIECEEESIRTIIEHNRRREEIKEEIFNEAEPTKSLLKTINEIKAR